jgi:hypothetical protein
MDKPMTKHAKPFFTTATLRLWAAGCCLVTGALLVSCGGQSSGTITTTDGSPQNSGGGSTPSLAMAGAYQGSVTYVGNAYPSDFISFLTPAGAWYGLYFLTTSSASVYPDIYTGALSATSTSSATISPLKASQFGKTVTTGSAAITGSSALNYRIDLTGINLANSQPASFSPSAITTITGIGGNWVGDLKDSQSVADTGLTLGFSDAGTLTSGGSYANCVLALQLTPQSVSSKPYYAASLQISGDTTTCGRVSRNNGNAVSMAGIGLIHASPVSGKTKRLELILTDTTGSGISFRGDQ